MFLTRLSGLKVVRQGPNSGFEPHSGVKRAIVVFVLACIAYLAVRGLSERSIEDIPFIPATDAVIREARQQGRVVLLAFTGSDWCAGSKRIEAEVFGTPEFATYIAGKAVLLRIDFPRQVQPRADEQEQNLALMQRFDITGFPTVVVIGRDGRERGRLGPAVAGVQAFLAELRPIVER